MKKKNLEKTADMLIGGGFALQGTRLLTGPRTIASLSGTATGFVGLGIAGMAMKASMGMVSSPYELTKKRKNYRRKRT